MKYPLYWQSKGGEIVAYLDNNGLLFFWTKLKAMFAGKVDKVDGKGLSTNDYTTDEKNKLKGIAYNANNYSHPTTAGNKHIPTGGKKGQILRWSASGTATWGNDNDTTYSVFKGASSWIAGDTGLVPKPAAGDNKLFLRGDGAWVAPKNTEYSDATQSVHGLMSTADKKKLDGFGNSDTYALKSDITAMYRYRGTVASKSDLPTKGNTAGDVYDVGDGMNYAWTGSKWDALGEVFSITDIKNTEIDAALDTVFNS